MDNNWVGTPLINQITQSNRAMVELKTSRFYFTKLETIPIIYILSLRTNFQIESLIAYA